LEGFLEALRQSECLDSSQVEEIRRDLTDQIPVADMLHDVSSKRDEQSAPAVAPPAVVHDVMMRWVEQGWLTRFQIDHIMQGRAAELRLENYVLLEPLGAGGMGQIYKARHKRLHYVVAVKVIRHDRLTDPQAIARFYREMRAVAKLSHPNIVRAFDGGECKGQHYIVMQYVPGPNLHELVKRQGSLFLSQACNYVRQAALGLQHAHEQGMVHRDIKPQNLILDWKGAVIRILDMGLARIDALGELSSNELTNDGVIVGTPDFMAPEQADNSHTADIRADLYSLGCTFYFLLTGKVPFPGGTLLSKIDRHRWEEPPSVARLRPEVSPWLAEVLRRLMAKRPAERYQTPEELIAELDSLGQERFALPASESFHKVPQVAGPVCVVLFPVLAREALAAHLVGEGASNPMATLVGQAVQVQGILECHQNSYQLVLGEVSDIRPLDKSLAATDP
jgi:serine/threonine protein kinase